MRELAVGIVRDVVEEDQPLDLDRPVVTRIARVADRRSLDRRLVELEAADSHRTVANQRSAGQCPHPSNFDKPIGRDFAQVERAVREVVERILAIARLVDRQLLAALAVTHDATANE